MYVCMHACMYVCMCMYVGMLACMYVWTDGWMDDIQTSLIFVAAIEASRSHALEGIAGIILLGRPGVPLQPLRTKHAQRVQVPIYQRLRPQSPRSYTYVCIYIYKPA